jgi:hypothetical protein
VEFLNEPIIDNVNLNQSNRDKAPFNLVFVSPSISGRNERVIDPNNDNIMVISDDILQPSSELTTNIVNQEFKSLNYDEIIRNVC